MAMTTSSLGILPTVFPSGAALGRVLTVGRLGLYAPEVFLRTWLREWGRHPAAESLALPTYFDELLRLCGVSDVSVMDGSSYEGAELIHDLNQEVPAAWTETFDTLVDAGTLEHVFSAVTALASYMKMVKVGGRLLLFDMPTTNLSGHGFYQFSPIFFSETLSEAFGFRLDAMLVSEDTPYGTLREIPRAELRAGRRIELVSSKPCFLYVLATKVAPFRGFLPAPVQPDYRIHWETGSEKASADTSATLAFRQQLANRVPAYFRFSHDRDQARQIRFKQLARFAPWTGAVRRS